MKFKQIAFFNALLFTLSLISYLNLSAVYAGNTGTTPNRYPKDFVDSFMKDCLQATSKQGLSQTDGKKLCTCTLNKFQAQYTLEQYRRLSRDAKEEVGYACAEEF
jgi:hypothetical protein